MTIKIKGTGILNPPTSPTCSTLYSRHRIMQGLSVDQNITEVRTSQAIASPPEIRRDLTVSHSLLLLARKHDVVLAICIHPGPISWAPSTKSLTSTQFRNSTPREAISSSPYFCTEKTATRPQKIPLELTLPARRPPPPQTHWSEAFVVLGNGLSPCWYERPAALADASSSLHTSPVPLWEQNVKGQSLS